MRLRVSSVVAVMTLGGVLAVTSAASSYFVPKK
jgi:hypothetical protein